MWVTGCRIGWGLVPRFKQRLMIICGLLASELAEDWVQGLSIGWWLYLGYWLQNWLRIGSKVDDYMWVTGCRIGWWLVPRFKPRLMIQYECLSEVSVAHFRGETFLILAMIVGEYGYASSALVRTRIAPFDSGELGDRQTIQEVGKICTNLTYSGTAQESIKLLLSVESLMGNKMPLSSLKVTLRPCPFGFNLSDNPPKCDCALHLRKPGVTSTLSWSIVQLLFGSETIQMKLWFTQTVHLTTASLRTMT